MLLIAIEPLTAPAALLCFVHAWAIPWLQARRGAESVVPIGSRRSAAHRPDADPGAERVALGLLGDLLDHQERDLAAATGLALQRGQMATWLVGEQGAFSIRRGGRRVDAWCVRVGDTDGLPAGDRVAHLLLALREDEGDFATVANMGFSGASWRVRRRLDLRSRKAFDVARGIARRAA